jgi:hypothetical protein
MASAATYPTDAAVLAVPTRDGPGFDRDRQPLTVEANRYP